MRSNEENQIMATMKVALGIMVAVVALIIAIGSFFTIDAGYVGIVTKFGKVSSIKGEGLNFKIPLITDVVKVDIRTMKVETSAVAASKNMQSTSTTVTVNYRLDPNKVGTLYSTVGLNVEEKIIASRVQDIVKTVTAKYTADELLAKREAIKTEIAVMLKNSLQEYYIIVNDNEVQITNFEFNKAYMQAVEDKQIAEQNALKAKNDLERIKVESEQAIAKAKGEAEAIRVQAEAIRAQGGQEYVQLKAIEKWDGKLPTYSGSSAVPFIKIN